jgi:predicted RNA binding protein YcfA (HicA-like mRNA interferase family)
MKYRDLVRKIEDDGWIQERTKGDHLQFRHPTKPGTVTVPGAVNLGETFHPAL